MIRSRLVAITICTLILAAAPAAQAQLTITEDTNPTCPGCVGVGTSSPGFQLEIHDSIDITKFGITSEYGGTSSTWAVAVASVADQLRLSRQGTGGAEFTLIGNGALKVGPGAATNLWLNGVGNLGLGLDLDPSTALHVRRTNEDAQVLIEGNGGFTGVIVSNGTSSNGGYWQVTHGAGGALAIDHTATIGTTGGAQEFRVFDSGLVDVAGGLVTGGDVGVGTASPAAAIHILQSGSAVTTSWDTGLIVQNSATPSSFALASLIGGAGANAQLNFGDETNPFRGRLIYNLADDSFRLFADGVEQWRFTADGRVGLGTTNPIVEIHVKDGDGPTVRLEQDGSSGSTPQTWDVAGNGDSFFVRDVTNGSKLPFRIKPGAADDSIFIAADGDIGMGTDGPSGDIGDVTGTQAKLHVRSTEATLSRPGLLYVENASPTAGYRYLLALKNAAGGGMGFRFVDGSTAIDTNNIGGEYRINFEDGDNQELSLDAAGNLTIDGQLTTATQTIPDYVFDESYELMSLAELQDFIQSNGHLPRIPTADEYAQRGGVNVSELQILLLEKIEELTLYTLEQNKRIEQLEAMLGAR
ncbi:hypothetical protein GF356_04160 [candidate division GN15 bacterium]|nr:hypothetical protein [candidate division GN15 bacterium]